MIQAKLTHLNEEFKIPRTKNFLTDSEKLYKKVKIFHYGKILFPGRLGEKKFDCGTIKSIFVCDCGTTSRVKKKSCNNHNCPNCHTVAKRRLAKKITTRLLEILNLRKKEGVAKPHFNHIAVSPDKKKLPELLTFEQYVKYKAKVVRILKKYNMGGVFFFHAYRIKIVVKEIVWKTNKNRFKDKTFEYMYYSPHFHLIGNMWIPPDFFAKHGFICTKIKVKDSNRLVKLFKKNHINSTVNYLLSHSTYYQGKKISVWIGDYSYNKMKKVNIKKDFEFSICPVCESYLFRLEEEPFDIDENYIYFSKYYRSSLNYDVKHAVIRITYNLIRTKR